MRAIWGVTMTGGAVFPISGPAANPTAGDYALEAFLLRQEASEMHRRRVKGAWRLYGLALRYDRTARRKRWAEQQAEQRARHLVQGAA